eukprot:g46676.t1
MENDQIRHVPVRRKDKDGKEKDMEDSEICVEHANMLGHFEIKKDAVLGHLKSIKVTKVIDDGRAVDVVNMDFSKAFDKVPLGRLIQKIKMREIHDDLCLRIGSSSSGSALDTGSAYQTVACHLCPERLRKKIILFFRRSGNIRFNLVWILPPISYSAGLICSCMRGGP